MSEPPPPVPPPPPELLFPPQDHNDIKSVRTNRPRATPVARDRLFLAIPRANPSGKVNANNKNLVLWLLARDACAEELSKTVMLVICGLVAVGCTIDGEKVQISCTAPLQVNVTLSAKPGVAFTVAFNVPLPPLAMVSVEVLSVPL